MSLSDNMVRAAKRAAEKLGQRPQPGPRTCGAADQAEQRAALTAGRLAALMSSVDCGVLLVGASDEVVEANDEGWALVRSRPGGAPPAVGALLLDGLVEAVRQARLGAPIRHLTLTGQGRTEVAMDASIVLLDEPGDPVLVVLRDITEIRRLETVRRDFVANVSHELRTPLASIRALAETLEAGALSEPDVARRFLGSIVSETERLTRIADDLLVLTEAESQPFTPAVVELDRLVMHVVQKLAPQAAAAGLTLTCGTEPDLSVPGNVDRLEQVLINLVDNAIKYTPARGSVKVSAYSTGGAATVEVADDGIGIMEHELERIFERFYRVDKARSRQSGGTGLGLSIVRRIVEAHGGTVGVTSRLNQGSCFTVRLPSAPLATLREGLAKV